jgi:hypothetical protein
MLSTYEYAQRGNIAKMKNRAGQALVKAMDLGLHSRGHEEGDDAEANRRAWWMTVSAMNSSLVDNANTPEVYLCVSRINIQQHGGCLYMV